MIYEVYEFVGYQLDCARERLRGPCGAEINLRPKTLATLLHLVRHRDRVVNKEELLETVWSGSVVEQQAVFQSISELRAQLAPQLCIETIRGRGYQWVCETTARQPPFQLENRRAGRTGIALAACALLAICLAVYLNRSAEPTIYVAPAGATTSQPAPLTADTGGFDAMLIEHLRRLGWDARPLGDKAAAADAWTLVTQVQTSTPQMQLYFELTGPTLETQGTIVSPSPLGAVRDLVARLNTNLKSGAADNPTLVSMATLFALARQHYDNDELAMAEAYARVVLEQQPQHPGAGVMLAQLYKDKGNYEDAKALAQSVYERAADKKPNAVEKMGSALLLSQLLLIDGLYGEARHLAQEAISLASASNDLLILSEAQEQLGEISFATGNGAAAIDQLQLALQLYRGFCPSGEARVSRRLTELARLDKS